jgi:transcription elongation factor Elf1
MDIKRGCVYFFRHIGLTPVKIGYSTNESPIERFNQFKTYAPYGSEILGFVILSNAKEIETLLHQKYANKRLSGEWFEITIEEVQKEVDFYSNISDIEERNNFQIAWAKEINNKKNKIVEDLDKEKKLEEKIRLNLEKQIREELKIKENKIPKREQFFRLYEKDKKLNRWHTADIFQVSRKTIFDWIKLYESKFNTKKAR